ncbi:MAG: MATE family efflux transporter [Marvinbryantia sp.]|mgnify:FL=1|uniref:MATE family efflux transporter n=1 Tax=Marvinbryantia sp. TaxID=2496532 RepID=UPI00399C0073
MNKKQSLDLTSGPIFKTLASLAMPIMASSFLATAYNITDMAWIGMLGSKAVAGIGVGGMFVWLSQGLVLFPRMGGQVNMAQCCGSRRLSEARSYAAAALQLTILFGILFGGVCLLFPDPLLSFFQMDDAETYHAAEIYMKITCGLIIFSYLTQTLTGLYTAQGDSKTPFKANLIGLIANMVLDPLLILGYGPFPRLEAAGAAIATVTAQMIVLAVLVIELLRAAPEHNLLKTVRLLRPVPGNYYRSISRIGIPSALQSSLYCMISMVLTRMVSAFGPGAIATQRVGGQIESLSWNTADGFGAALNAFVAQNYGAKKTQRIRESYRISLRILVVWGLLITAAFLLLPRSISHLFFYEPEVVEISANYLIIIGCSEVFMSVELMTVGALSGLGRTTLCSVISILFTGARIPLALLLSRTSLGLSGIWWALTLTSVAKGIIFYFAFQYVQRGIEKQL